MLSSTERFSSRVDNYVKYRPGYPSNPNNKGRSCFPIKHWFITASWPEADTLDRVARFAKRCSRLVRFSAAKRFFDERFGYINERRSAGYRYAAR